MSKLSEYSKFDHLDEYDDVDDHDRVLIRHQQHGSKMDPICSDDLKNQPQQQQQQQQQQTTSPSSSSTTSPTRIQQDEHMLLSTPNTVAPNAARMYPIQRNHNNGSRRTVFVFEYNNQIIYEWEQGLTDVIITIPGPPLVRLKSHDIQCHITPNHLQLKLKNSNQYYIDEYFYETTDVHESTWTIEDNDDNNKKQQQNIVIYLHKVAKGLVWLSALKGRFDNIQIDPYYMEIVKQEILKERWHEENPTMDFSEASFNNSTMIPDPRTYMGGVRYS